MSNDNLTFGAALEACKDGAEVSRSAWGGSSAPISMKAQFPDENSKMTKPYLYMIKGEDKFPLDLSCESIFASDWFVVTSGTVGGSADNSATANTAGGEGSTANVGGEAAQA